MHSYHIHAMAMQEMSLSQRVNADPNIPYKIQRDTEVPARDDQECYVVTMDDGNILRVTVTTDGYRILNWLDTATDLYGSGLVGIHAEPRLFKSKLVHASLQPSIHVLFFAIGRRVLVYELVRGNRDLFWMLMIQLVRLHFNPYRFVGMHMERIRRCLKVYNQYLENIIEVEELAAEHTGREELRTAGLKKITRAVMGIDLDPVLSSRFWMDRWLSDGLSPVLVMQGSIRVFMALMVVRTIRNYPPLPHEQAAAGSSSGSGSGHPQHDQQEQAAGSSSGSGSGSGQPQHDQQEQAAGSSSGSGQPQHVQKLFAAVKAVMADRTIRNHPPLPLHDQQEQAAGSSSGSGQPQHDQQQEAGSSSGSDQPQHDQQQAAGSSSGSSSFSFHS